MQKSYQNRWCATQNPMRALWRPPCVPLYCSVARAGLIGDLLVSCCVPCGTPGVVFGFHEARRGGLFVSRCVSSGTPGVALGCHESFILGISGVRVPLGRFAGRAGNIRPVRITLAGLLGQISLCSHAPANPFTNLSNSFQFGDLAALAPPGPDSSFPTPSREPYRIPTKFVPIR